MPQVLSSGLPAVPQASIPARARKVDSVPTCSFFPRPVLVQDSKETDAPATSDTNFWLFLWMGTKTDSWSLLCKQ